MGSVLQKGAVRCVGILHPSLQCLSAWHLLLGCGNTLTNRRMMHGPCARFVCLFCTAVFLFHFQLCKEANKKEFFLKFCGSTSAMASHLKSQHNVVQYGPKGLTAINEGFSPPPPRSKTNNSFHRKDYGGTIGWAKIIGTGKLLRAVGLKCTTISADPGSPLPGPIWPLYPPGP